jgi:hypothetical protein
VGRGDEVGDAEADQAAARVDRGRSASKHTLIPAVTGPVRECTPHCPMPVSKLKTRLVQQNAP